MKFPIEEYERIKDAPFVRENVVWPVSTTEVSHEPSWGATILLYVKTLFSNGSEYFLLTPPAAQRFSEILWRDVRNYLSSDLTQEPSLLQELDFPKERFDQLAEENAFKGKRPIWPTSVVGVSRDLDLGDATMIIQIGGYLHKKPSHFLMTPPAAKQLARALTRTVDGYLDSA